MPDRQGIKSPSLPKKEQIKYYIVYIYIYLMLLNLLFNVSLVLGMEAITTGTVEVQAFFSGPGGSSRATAKTRT